MLFALYEITCMVDMIVYLLLMFRYQESLHAQVYLAMYKLYSC